MSLCSIELQQIANVKTRGSGVTEKIKESISALVDEEISEIEVHRLLRQYADDDDLRTTFVSYQQIRAVIKQENHLSHAQHVDLHSNILAAIELEDVPELSSQIMGEGEPRLAQKGASRKTVIMFPERMKMPAAAMAVAASMVVAVFVGFNVLENPANVGSQGDVNGLAANNASNTATNPSINAAMKGSLDRSVGEGTNSPSQVSASGLLETQAVSNQVAMQDGVGSGLQSELIDVNDSLGELRELDPNKQRQLRQYLNQHDRNIRMNPYARTVDYKQPKQK
mgnify:CR=1 FL=1|jgi:negative regulator of sigma E activity